MRDATFRSDLAQVLFEQDGLEGLRIWLKEVALADAWNETQGHVVPSRIAKHAAAPHKTNAHTDADFATLRAALKAEGLDFRIVSAE